MSLTYNEMKGQYFALRKTYDYILKKKDEIICFFNEKSPKSLMFLGCGSGYCLAQSAEFSARIRLGMPSMALVGGDLLLNYKQYGNFLKDTMIIAPTRTGSTSEVVDSIRNVRSMAATPVIAISCTEGSPLSKESDLVLELPWAYDNSVCQTRTVTNLYMANLLVIATLCNDMKLIKDVETAIRLGDVFIEEYETKIKEVALTDWSDVVILADGELQGIANEAAMAFTEIAGIPARYYHCLDVRHGPMVLVNENTLVVVNTTSHGIKYQKDLIGEIRKRGAKVVAYSATKEGMVDDVELAVISGADLDTAACGIPFIFISQALSYFKAERLGMNPDKPDGIVAWVNLNK